MSRSSSFDIPTARKKSTKIPSFTGRHRAVPWCRARCRRCTRSSGRGFARLLTEMILPVCQFFAYLEVETGGSTFDMPDSSLWTLYQRLRADGAPLSMRKVSDRSQIFPVFHDLFHRRGKQERAAP